jgi:CRISPR-associated endonuclease/helicase Cas3
MTPLWAKLVRDDAGAVTGWHSLVDHSADVAAVVSALLEQPTINRRLATTAGRDTLDTITCARLAALAFLHDIGKANRGFQLRRDPVAPPVGHIDQLAWIYVTNGGTAYADRLRDTLGLDRVEAWFADADTAFETWSSLFAHHGQPWSEQPADAAAYWRLGPDGDPIAALAPMRAALDTWFAPAFTPGPCLPSAPEFVHAFAGLLMLADWLGSDTQFFPFAHGEAADRMTFALPAARHAVCLVGLAVEGRRATLRTSAPDFAGVFGFAPHDMQREAARAIARCLVVESETGSGKTEAAIARFIQLFLVGAVDGLYFALPTRVAATALFARVKQACAALFPVDDPPTVVLAVPGQVMADDARGYALPDFGFAWTDRPDEAKRQARWAAEHPKRFLAAQIVVGTVDQALLGTIATKHAHLRGTALLRHLLVVDEVHASDTYMEVLLSNLLRDHLHAGGHACLLSATLGAGMRSRLLGTPCPPLAEAIAAPYPALSWADAGEAHTHRAEGTTDTVTGQPRTKAVQVQPVPTIDDPDAIAAAALQAAQEGARVLVVRNTVGAAIAVQQALEAAAGADAEVLFRVNGIATLHHGRFAATDRRLLDAAVETELGKNRRGGGGRIVVGTQTLEQSLDIDADLLISDLCPADVLLQRIGRLHRHHRVRPAGFDVARVVVLTPERRDLLATLRSRRRHGMGLVYPDACIVEATWRLLEAGAVWQVPALNRHLVEMATHPEVLAQIEQELIARDARWTELLDRQHGRHFAEIQQGQRALLDRARPFTDFRLDPDERWATRLGAHDLLAAFDLPLDGPFGAPVSRIRVRSWLVPDADADDEVEALERAPGRCVFRLGPHLLRYDRFGLQSQ